MLPELIDLAKDDQSPNWFRAVIAIGKFGESAQVAAPALDDVATGAVEPDRELPQQLELMQGFPLLASQAVDRVVPSESQRPHHFGQRLVQ